MAGRLHASEALLPAGWAGDVLVEWDDRGSLTAVTPGTAWDGTAPRAAGPVIPGVPNLHSHAFQRAFAGLTEHRGAEADSFWTWRDRMYRVALAVTPAEVEAIATWVYVELLEHGFTSVCEFHYLHNDSEGRAYADDATIASHLVRAAERTGIGLTLLPALYQHGGFGGAPPKPEQRRFVRTTASLLRLIAAARPLCRAIDGRVGMAVHSLRAVAPEALADVLQGLDAADASAPRHVHVAEQRREVEECVAWSGQRPVEWLLDHVALDERWCLVHATHLRADEAWRASRTGAVAGLCPTTEANLGDGIFDLPAWTRGAGAAGGRWGIGTDSHVGVDAAGELRMLEYSQRLATGRRNVTCRPDLPFAGTAMTLAAVSGGALAAGRPVAGLVPGQRADFVVLDRRAPMLAGLPAASALDAHVFAAAGPSVASVVAGGRELVRDGRHHAREAAALGFVEARRSLSSRM
ncbi:MAG: formimidoylglutamate deiminase [Vicinamibacterales bacterium]